MCDSVVVVGFKRRGKEVEEGYAFDHLISMTTFSKAWSAFLGTSWTPVSARGTSDGSNVLIKRSRRYVLRWEREHREKAAGQDVTVEY